MKKFSCKYFAKIIWNTLTIEDVFEILISNRMTSQNDKYKNVLNKCLEVCGESENIALYNDWELEQISAHVTRFLSEFGRLCDNIKKFGEYESL